MDSVEVTNVIIQGSETMKHQQMYNEKLEDAMEQIKEAQELQEEMNRNFE